MFIKSNIDTRLEEEIISQLETLKSQKDDPSKYDATVERITKLDKLRSDSGFKTPSVDNLLVVGANIFSVLWLTRFEKEHVIPSKAALGFVMKPR